MEFKTYHKIRQFKDVVRDIHHQANFKGLDENKQPIYEETKKPILKFTGTIKLHGTNAGICYTPEEGVVAQKRSSLITGDKPDAHMGFNNFVKHTQKDEIDYLMETLWSIFCKDKEQITLYGEWAGEGIQKGVGISELPKSFYAFDCKVYNPLTDESRWVDIKDIEFGIIDNVYNIYDFPTFEMEIDFNNPGLSQNKLIEITNSVEQECPVTKRLGGSGIGEGVVWSSFWKGQKYIFKVKGEKHSTSKVKKLASVNPEVLNSINQFVDYACTQNRIEQGIKEVDAKEKRDMPNLLKWVANDIISEESDTLKENKLEWSQVARECNNRIRQYFFTKLDSI